VDCFDHARSVFTPGKRFAMDIKKVAINEDACGSLPLVLVAKTIPFLLVARDDLADSVIARGCTGVVFRSPDDWRNPIDPLD
jgi:hypothetical protein